MKIISSQRHINYDIVEEKKEELKGAEYIVLPILDAEMVDLDGNNLFILTDGHHRKEAAEELGIEIRFEEISNQHYLTGEELLNECWMDSNWYYIESGNLVW